MATLETRPRTKEEMEEWFVKRNEKYKVIVIENTEGKILGWASLNQYNSRCCYKGIADISIYIKGSMRGKGIGKKLMRYLIKTAKNESFYKLVLKMISHNKAAKGLYLSMGFREVGIYKRHGMLDGNWVDITIMEKLLTD